MSTRRLNGFTLVEVMVALMVLSIGLLGVAKLSFSSVQSNNSAYLRTQGAQLIQQVFDDMRANRVQAAVGAYNIAFGAGAPGFATDCSQAVCTDTQMATYDLAKWKQRLKEALPGGDGQVVTALGVTAAGSQELVATVSVQWDDAVAQQTFAAGSGTTQTVTVESVL